MWTPVVAPLDKPHDPVVVWLLKLGPWGTSSNDLRTLRLAIAKAVLVRFAKSCDIVR